MKTIKILLVILLSYTFKGHSQEGKNVISIGGELSFPAHAYQTNKAIGTGINFKVEHFLSDKFSGSISGGYSFFKGKIIYWDGKTDNDFALIPVLVGARYYFQKFYLNFEIGAAVRASKNVYTNLALAPSAGILLSKFDLALKLLGIPQTFNGIPESTFLQKGGYSYLGLRIFYKLN